MRAILARDEAQALVRSQFPERLNYRYPCNFTETDDKCDITVEIKYNPQPIGGFNRTGQHLYRKWMGDSFQNFPNNVVINDHLDKEAYPIGIYHLNRVPCTCPTPLKKLSQQIQSLFGKKITQANCKVHTKEFDVYLRSNHPLFKKR